MRASHGSLLALLLAVGCNAPHTGPAHPEPRTPPLRAKVAEAKPMPPLVLSGTFADGTPLTMASLAGKPWVVNLWLPG